MHLTGGVQLSAEKKERKGKEKGGGRGEIRWAGSGLLPRVGPIGLVSFSFLFFFLFFFCFSVFSFKL
jgi:hypothetical protein